MWSASSCSIRSRSCGSLSQWPSLWAKRRPNIAGLPSFTSLPCSCWCHSLCSDFPWLVIWSSTARWSHSPLLCWSLQSSPVYNAKSPAFCQLDYATGNSCHCGWGPWRRSTLYSPSFRVVKDVWNRRGMPSTKNWITVEVLVTSRPKKLWNNYRWNKRSDMIRTFPNTSYEPGKMDNVWPPVDCPGINTSYWLWL